MFPVREEGKNNLFSYKASSDPNTMYMHKAMKEPDRKQFTNSMEKEVANKSNNKKFLVIHQSKVPEGATILPTVWKMKRKQDIKT